MIGFGSGVGFERWQRPSVSDLLSRIPVAHAAANATRCVSVLQVWRTGETERAANMLETYLDGDLVALGQPYQTTTPKQREAAWAPQAIRIAREYREAHPHGPRRFNCWRGARNAFCSDARTQAQVMGLTRRCSDASRVIVIS